MDAVLNLARARCAAASSDGSMSPCARSSWHAASREIGVAPAVAKSAAVADSASENKVAIFNFIYFETCPFEPANSVGNDNNGLRESLSFCRFREIFALAE